MYEYSAALGRVVDGDTVWFSADLGFRCSVEVDIRLAGLNCPEHGTAEGDAATAFTQAWFAQHAGPYVLATEKDRREKYGRYLGRVTAPDGVCLNVDLLQSGHAVPYDGGKRLLAGVMCPRCGAAAVQSLCEGCWEEIAAANAQSGVDTPGCDCGHEGMGSAWHLKPCPHAA